MTEPVSERFEVMVARWKLALVTMIIFVTIGTACVLFYYSKARLPFLALPLISMSTLAVAYGSLWFRRDPICVIDDQGITEYGFFLRGFGLIRWQNIKGVNKFSDRNGVSLLVKVDNFDQLVARRNLFIRPFILMNGSLCRILGGQILLPIAWSSTNAEAVLEQIHRFSKNRTELEQPMTAFQTFQAQLSVGFIVLFLFFSTLSLCAVTYWFFTHIRNPELHVIGGNPGDRETEISKGKQVWLKDLIIQNFGQNASGLKLEIFGDAFDSNLVKNPQVLIEYEDNSRVGNPYFSRKIRELVPLVQVKKDHFSGVLESVLLAHKDDELLEPLQLFSGKYTHSIGWWTNLLGPCLTLELFADVPKTGRGNMILKVYPLSFSGGGATDVIRVATTEKHRGDSPILSEGIPKNFPVTAYPESNILWLSPKEVKLDSPETANVIAAYYKQELSQKGWKTEVKEDPLSGELVVYATKGKASVDIRMAQIDHHTPIMIFLK